ncbi:hypothetical protein LOTGIDRAFT_173482 [Lottia gigantea]|uniref:Serum amyloid A protein n=1 Tax=Lottia gigantea TaxID=225164 RepID=V4A7A2_LOTGI|nr:hypothetical protein LOTGIDRAFT_173482 [Lottia gigantea]ESO99823.1 hypothetical protein LOTGIDRAFT_173482 [Lottia gigantea]
MELLSLMDYSPPQSFKMDKTILMAVTTLIATIVLINCVSGLGDAKQSSFGGYPSSDGKYQDWYEWMVKRNFGGGNGGFGFQDGAGRFVNWEDVYRNAKAKRQLSVSPDGFGNYGSYFSNGLQDWRRAFRGTKRNTKREN